MTMNGRNASQADFSGADMRQHNFFGTKDNCKAVHLYSRNTLQRYRFYLDRTLSAESGWVTTHARGSAATSDSRCMTANGTHSEVHCVPLTENDFYLLAFLSWTKNRRKTKNDHTETTIPL